MQLLQSLEERMKAWNSTQLMGDLFLKLLPFLRIYSIYTSNYERSSSTCQELLEHNPAFHAFCNDKATNEARCHLAPLNSFLILPVQRIPRYRLLLEDLVKHTAPAHPDYKHLEESLVTINQVAKEVNEEMKAQEARKKLLDMQARVGSCFQLVAPHRVFVREGLVWKVCRKTNKRRTFLLFNDLLIYGEDTLAYGFSFHRKIDVDVMCVKDHPDSPTLKNAFSIGSSQKSFITFTDTPEEKAEWLAALNDCLEQYRKRQRSFSNVEHANSKAFQAPVWQTDSEVVECTMCKVPFSMLNRRHHCRLCGFVVCGTCSAQKMPIPAFTDKQRVCITCFSMYNDAVAAPSPATPPPTSAAAPSSVPQPTQAPSPRGPPPRPPPLTQEQRVHGQ
eukprot:TRINITY_DN4633_c0_g1_i2.p1 TRINITY_DN4633_c0_g1~~TRINITY_DN4633_c0_g1_i2.p1  ORF type:complete len:390 (+),score=87.26 TRINITY_DN4633_c0_g1_i2:616-1785(+)